MFALTDFARETTVFAQSRLLGVNSCARTARPQRSCRRVYAHLAGELKATMMLSGVAKVVDLKRDNIALAKA